MRAVIQRVSRAQVSVDGVLAGSIDRGLCVLVGAVEGDTKLDADFVAGKIASLRIFPDAEQRMNLDVQQAGGSILLISQFTLAADTTSGTRPSFSSALAPAEAEPMLEDMLATLRARGLRVETGRFGAVMQVELINDGPVTIIVDSKAKRRK